MLRVVLDTNAVLDCFAFSDPNAQTLVSQMASARIQVVTRSDLRAELVRVLAYDHLPFDSARRQMTLMRYDEYAIAIDAINYDANPSDSPPPGASPPGVIQSDATQSDATQSDATQSDATQSDAKQSGVTQSGAMQSNSIERFKLPRCRDPDDQKFLEVARDARAHLLVSKDKALLELVRGRRKSLPFRILTPAGYNAAFDIAARASPTV